MRGNLGGTEPGRLERWTERDLYRLMIDRNKGKPAFILHDGPPYANGTIHSGTVLNKILKDFVVKHRNMCGLFTEYVPGWDCHGLPIENNVERELGSAKSSLTIDQFRSRCREFALRFVDIQREQFKRLGVLGDWENPYLTLHHGYEATIAREFGRVMATGSLYRGKKPVYWCAHHRTALAEAEIEYGDHSSPSIWVTFEMAEDARAKASVPADKPAHVVIWTTTPWTLPANLAITLHPQFQYALVDVGDRIYLVAEDLVETFAKDVGLSGYTVSGTVRGDALELTHAKHPFMDRESLIIMGHFVTLDAGTGCVHTAPGHGVDDYVVGVGYGLEAYAPVDENGRFTEDVTGFEGRNVFEADNDICAMLKERGVLLGRRELSHPYPFCERCKEPIIFRATDQWFISMDEAGIRARALAEIDRVTWVPPRGQERIRSMVESRPDWCISRQRLWGVPIIVFYCESCGEPLMDPKVVFNVADIFVEHGADAWFTKTSRELMPEGTACSSCGGGEFRKENDIIDVWFESGVSYAAVTEARYGKDTIADLYLEGSDQHRGWFHSTLLESVATRHRAPYATVLTHGFVVDGEGRKISKTLGNYVPPEEIIKKHGAEIYRLWVAAENYQDDIRLSDEIIRTLMDAYRKIRNTFRFLLGNLEGFDPDQDLMAVEDLEPVDQWMLHRLNEVLVTISDAYERYDFHRIYQLVLNFMTVDLSAVYLDVLKDRLYVLGRFDTRRRSGRTVLYHLARSLTLALAPILTFTCDEIWEHMPRPIDASPSPLLEDFPRFRSDWNRPARAAVFDHLREVRVAVQKLLEEARNEKIVGHPLEAQVTLRVGGAHPAASALEIHRDFLEEWLIVSSMDVGFVDGAGLGISVSHAPGAKCPRCWHWEESIGTNPTHPDLCARCAEVLSQETR
ncbi:MAG: isoleucine--tRNA ligase [Pseudomonadota bacterium]